MALTKMSWYYMSSGGVQVGPVDDSVFSQLARSGAIQDSTMVWREGMPAWQSYFAVRTGGAASPAPAPPAPVYQAAVPGGQPFAGYGAALAMGPQMPFVAMPVPPYKLFDAGSVTIGTIFGSPIAGGLLLALNYSRLGQAGKAAGSFVLGLVLSVGAVLLGFVIPSAASTGLGVGLLMVMRQLAKTQEPAIGLHVAQGGRLASKWSAFGIGLGWLAAICAVGFGVFYGIDAIKNGPSVAIGANDKVHYSGTATKEEALALGAALKRIGYLSDRGAVVLLAKGSRGGATVGFVVKDTTADKPEMVAAFEEIGRQIAVSVGGFPIQVRLLNGDKEIQKDLTVGRVGSAGKDEVYFLGSATETQARALADFLRTDGYFSGLGASVFLAKHDRGTIISFVVRNGFWESPANVAAFGNLVRKASPTVGGLPVTFRLITGKLEVQREVVVR